MDRLIVISVILHVKHAQMGQLAILAEVINFWMELVKVALLLTGRIVELATLRSV